MEKINFNQRIRKYNDKFLEGHLKEENEKSASISGETIRIGDTLYIVLDNQIICGELTEFVVDTWTNNYYNVEELNIEGTSIPLTEILWLGIK